VSGTERSARTLRKTRIFALIVILSSLAGNSLLSVGLHQMGSLIGQSPLAYILALANPFVAAGVVLLIIWMISHMVLLSWADLSYVLPVTSLGYVLTAVVGRIFLQESVSLSRWVGVSVIMLGFVLVSRTTPSAKPRTVINGEKKRELVLQ
jgi:uncharacterized membrane protein